MKILKTTSWFCFSETMATPTAKKNDGFKKKMANTTVRLEYSIQLYEKQYCVFFIYNINT